MLTIDQIRAVVSDYFKDKPVKKVWLFGSYARGEADDESDVDLLVIYDETCKRLNYFQLGRFLGELQDLFHSDVDLVDEETLHPRLRRNVFEERKLLYAA